MKNKEMEEMKLKESEDKKEGKRIHAKEKKIKENANYILFDKKKKYRKEYTNIRTKRRRQNKKKKNII